MPEITPQPQAEQGQKQAPVSSEGVPNTTDQKRGAEVVKQLFSKEGRASLLRKTQERVRVRAEELKIDTANARQFANDIGDLIRQNPKDAVRTVAFVAGAGLAIGVMIAAGDVSVTTLVEHGLNGQAIADVFQQYLPNLIPAAAGIVGVGVGHEGADNLVDEWKALRNPEMQDENQMQQQ